MAGKLVAADAQAAFTDGSGVWYPFVAIRIVGLIGDSDMAHGQIGGVNTHAMNLRPSRAGFFRRFVESPLNPIGCHIQIVANRVAAVVAPEQ